MTIFDKDAVEKQKGAFFLKGFTLIRARAGPIRTHMVGPYGPEKSCKKPNQSSLQTESIIKCNQKQDGMPANFQKHLPCNYT